MKLLPYKLIKVKGESMLPTIKPNQYALVRKTKHVKSNDLVLLRHPYKNLLLIKRVLSRRGNEVFIVGDNVMKSTDSRHFGSVSIHHIIGKIIYLF